MSFRGTIPALLFFTLFCHPAFGQDGSSIIPIKNTAETMESLIPSEQDGPAFPEQSQNLSGPKTLHENPYAPSASRKLFNFQPPPKRPKLPVLPALPKRVILKIKRPELFSLPNREPISLKAVLPKRPPVMPELPFFLNKKPVIQKYELPQAPVLFKIPARPEGDFFPEDKHFPQGRRAQKNEDFDSGRTNFWMALGSALAGIGYFIRRFWGRIISNLNRTELSHR